MSNRLVYSVLAVFLGFAARVGAQTFSDIYDFQDTPDGKNPDAGLVASGNMLYGGTEAGGASSSGPGTIFSLPDSGSPLTVLRSLTTATDGGAPFNTLTLSGNTLYGVCAGGGANSAGTVFRVNTDDTDFTNIHNFDAINDSGPQGLQENGLGSNNNGSTPHTTLVLSGTNLFGVALYGGANGNGTVFRVSTDGSSFSVLHTFSAAPTAFGATNTDGGFPNGNLVLANGVLYGTTSAGGSQGDGTVYSISTNGSNFTVLHTMGTTPSGAPFSGDGQVPECGMVLSGTNLFGTARSGGGNLGGTIFKISTNGAGYTTLYSFASGSSPQSGLTLLGTNLFGVTYQGGAHSEGTLFAISTSGGNTYTDYYDFASLNGSGDNSGGAGPYGGLVFSGNSLYGTAANGGAYSYGAAFQFTVPASILASIPPQLQTDVQTPFYALPGGSTSNSVSVTGSNLGYQWQFNGTNLTDGANISGSKSNVLTLFNVQLGEAGNYQVAITNAASSITSSVAALTVLGGYPAGFVSSGFGWTGNQAGTFTTSIFSGNVLTLTDNGATEARSYFFDVPEYIGGFEASFTYQDVNEGVADGVAFVVQNDPRGTAALGSAGGYLGVGGTGLITPSAELELNLYPENGELPGYTFLTGGLTGIGGANGNYRSTGNVNLSSGDPINVIMYYALGHLALTFTDTVSQVTFSTNLYIGNLTNIVGGSTAYVGFTGGAGSITSMQTISNFSFTSLPLTGINLSSKNTVLSWPTSVTGYTLQANTNLITGTWVNVTNQQTVVNGQNMVTIPMTTSNEFYRLVFP
ncbi:MAG TPA: choice-of-anchor tandem repeat GloVer-containing protein [Verrucomicrobiae bacterium]